LPDKPSAYLEVEERLNPTKICVRLQEKRKGIFVIDFVILFIDYIDDAFIVFDRKKDKNIGMHTSSVLPVGDGMNKFLKSAGITFGRKITTGMPRANKSDNIIDRGQKEKREYYYGD